MQIKNCMLTEGLHDALYSLYDIDAGRLNDSYNMLVNINANSNGGNAVFRKYVGVENLEDALRDSDFVINAVQVGGYEPCTVTDFEIPKKYGLRQTIADTLGVGGVFRALRTIPVMQMFAEKIEKVCPKALFMNYSNPMGILTGYMLRNTNVKTIGLLPQRSEVRKNSAGRVRIALQRPDSVENCRHQPYGVAAGNF